jgi:hypothetical protein
MGYGLWAMSYELSLMQNSKHSADIGRIAPDKGRAAQVPPLPTKDVPL